VASSPAEKTVEQQANPAYPVASHFRLRSHGQGNDCQRNLNSPDNHSADYFVFGQQPDRQKRNKGSKKMFLALSLGYLVVKK
jgi:hypothetical protein